MTILMDSLSFKGRWIRPYIGRLNKEHQDKSFSLKIVNWKENELEGIMLGIFFP